jgi:predicted Zn-dependent peptidase
MVVLLVRPLQSGESKTELAPVGPDPGTASQTQPGTRQPGAGPDWSKLPGPAKTQRFRPPRYVRRSLSNGIDTWISTWRMLPLVQVYFTVPIGTGDDPDGQEGLAHLAARMLDQGTGSRTATELAEAFEQLGATVRVAVDGDDTSLSVRVLARNLKPTLTLLAEMLESPRFDRQDFERERTQQIASLLQGPDDVGWLAHRALPLVMFHRSHPYGKPPEGYPETVKQLTLEKLRAFHAGGFGSKGTSLIVTGDVDPDELALLLEETLGRWRGDNPGPIPRPVVAVKPESGVVYLVDKPGAVQSVINVSRHWLNRQDPRYLATLVGNHLLGVDFLSRLNKNLREDHGYTYGSRSAFDFRRGRSVWSVSTDVRADATAPALREILKELDALGLARPITAEELEKARSAEVRSYPEGFESPAGIAAALAEMAEFGLPADYLETFLPNLAKVTLSETQRAITEVVAPADRFILVVGDRKTVEPELTKAGFKAIKVITYDGKPIGN